LPSNAPLVFVAHSFTGSAQGIMGYSGMNSIADQNGFAVCYPQGTKDDWNDSFWNVGYDFHSGVTVDDIGFLESLASFLQLTYQLNTEKTFFTGMSNGGEMCYLLAFDGTNVFKAFAPVAGTVFPNGLINNLFSPIASVPFFITHADNDNVTYFNGDTYDMSWGPYLSVDTLVNFWVNENLLSNLTIDTFPDLDNNGKITISNKYSSLSSVNEVWLYTHQNNHNWGDGDIIIEQEIWNFFSLMSNNSTDISDISPTKKILYVRNLLGQKITDIKNKLLFYIYDNGEVEKKIILD
jgi:polyhydroxybutyrate depolymerase